MRACFSVLAFGFLSLAVAAVVGSYCHWADWLAFGHVADRALSYQASIGALIAGAGALVSVNAARSERV